jgi:hypothetical protein
MPDFDLAFRFTMGEEGVKFDELGNVTNSGLNNNPADPGGNTNFGFAQKYNQDIDVAQLTLASAKQRAYDKYWIPSGADKLLWPVNVIIFDTYFNQSPAESSSLKFASSWEDMLWARLAQYAAKHPADPVFTRWWLNRVLHLRSFILDRGV